MNPAPARLMALLADSHAALGVSLPAALAVRMAGLLGQAMSGPRRLYHALPHVYEVCAGMNPTQTLAGIFHDLVYVQLDDGLAPPLAAQLGGLLQPVAGAAHVYHIDLAAAGSDHWPALTTRLFGRRDGDCLGPADGINEFASALVAGRLLQAHLAPSQLLAVLAGIEATIPFRPAMPACLLERLRLTVEAARLDCDEAALQVIVRDAVVLANRDVAGLADADAGRFLAHTWLLIVEGNAPLADRHKVSLLDYRRALARMEAFLSGFNPATVFHAVAEVPFDEPALAAAVRANLDFASEFFAGKLLAAAIVEAAALLSGGDCPVAALLGHMRDQPGSPRRRIEDSLPALPEHALARLELLAILRHGRPDDDPDNGLRSPFSAYVYAYLGGPATQALFTRARAMFAGELAPADFLALLPAPLRTPLLEGCADLCPERRPALLDLARQLAAAP